VSRALDGLLDQISRLQARVSTLEVEQQANGTHVNGTNGASSEVLSEDDAASAVYELRNHI